MDFVKAFKTTTLLPGEGFKVPVKSKADASLLVAVEPRMEAPKGFIQDHLQEIEDGTIFVRNMSSEPIKIKKNTPLCQIMETREVRESSYVTKAGNNRL